MMWTIMSSNAISVSTVSILILILLGYCSLYLYQQVFGRIYQRILLKVFKNLKDIM